jgi:hypothetical protein
LQPNNLGLHNWGLNSSCNCCAAVPQKETHALFPDWFKHSARAFLLCQQKQQRELYNNAADGRSCLGHLPTELVSFNNATLLRTFQEFCAGYGPILLVMLNLQSWADGCQVLWALKFPQNA